MLNWIWQGCAVALAAFLSLRVLDRSRAQARYVVGASALLAVVALPVVSWLLSRTPAGLVTAGSGSTDVAIAIPTAWWPSAAVVLCVWGLWCAVHVGRLVAMLIAVRRARRASRPCPAAVESRLPCWTAVRDRGRPARLVISPNVSSAAVLGCGSPVIALAPALLGHLTDDELDRVVLHEWAHVQRRDDLLNALHIAVCAVAGWHPAVIALERQLRIEREAACDEMAVAVAGSPKRYAACLTTIAALGVGRQPASALGAFSSPALRQRVRRILSHGNLASARWSSRTAGFAVVLLVALAVSVAGVRLIAKASSHGGASPHAATQPASDPHGPLVRAIVSSGAAVARARHQPPPPAAPERHVAMPAVPTVAAAPDMDQRPLPNEPLSSTASRPIVPLVKVDMRPPPAIADAGSSLPRRPADTPWGAAADAGVAIGRGSQKAATATAGFFSRAGKGLARSFSN